MSLPNFPPFTSANDIPKHPLEITKDKGGINCTNNDDPGFFSVVSSFAKKIAGKVFKGKFNFSSMQRPTVLSNPESHLQVLASEFALAFEYFSMAAGVQNDIDRLKLIVAGTVGNMSHNVFRSLGKGPVNPTLGETFAVT